MKRICAAWLARSSEQFYLIVFLCSFADMFHVPYHAGCLPNSIYAASLAGVTFFLCTYPDGSKPRGAVRVALGVFTLRKAPPPQGGELQAIYRIAPSLSQARG